MLLVFFRPGKKCRWSYPIKTWCFVMYNIYGGVRSFAYKVVKFWSNPMAKSSLGMRGWWNGECKKNVGVFSLIKFSLKNSRVRHQWLRGRPCLEKTMFCCESHKIQMYMDLGSFYLFYVFLVHAINRVIYRMNNGLICVGPLEIQALWSIIRVSGGLVTFPEGCIHDHDLANMGDSLYSPYIFNVLTWLAST